MFQDSNGVSVLTSVLSNSSPAITAFATAEAGKPL